ncbi:outer membrane protein [Alcanivorax hongdengensis A-11-3]|uniref:Outer membrane protein n=1 Tax=Alcanivorax hongdengensis A-11-3 TaxID=1177179 RepID=L0WCP8_9GAMM|nr:membrane protein [Alcanivorax hongdengensis]EKF74731.1 outer membrane protein [Alcanivorax hongdengensis A-11-3]
MVKRGGWWLVCLSVASGAWAEPLVQRNPTVVPQDVPYYRATVRNTELIFTQQNKTFAEHAAGVELSLQPDYEATFGYRMDAPLNVGLISDNNQIANGFSTQYPLNRQINYVGGAAAVDYFAATSWLDTLLFHETAHNYQLNAKDNRVSRSLHTVLGNGSFMLPFFPAIVPNAFESSFMLEGNAVLNESRHGNGGRLYSGRFDALVHAKAKAGELTPARAYNQTLFFPYGENSYALGSHYQYFLADHYGLDATNRYFKVRSRYWYLPFVTNAPLQTAIGKDFDSTFADWVAHERQQADKAVMSSGTPLMTSKHFNALNSDSKEIFFLASPQDVRAPYKVELDRHTATLQKTRTTFRAGELFRHAGSTWSMASAYSSPWRISQGLYSESAILKGDTRGRVIQGYTRAGVPVYFDVASSYDQPQLYVGEQFYGQVNSSVEVHGDDLYYFVQNGAERTLYRNRTPLYHYQGYYGVVADVDSQGRVLFVANSEYGSALYRVATDGAVVRVLPEDDIVAARLLDDERVLAVAIQADHYGYYLKSLQPRSGQPFVRTLRWDTPAGQADNLTTDAPSQPLTLDRPYHSWTALRYSGSDVYLSLLSDDDDPATPQDESDTHTLYNVQVRFADPLEQNQLSLFSYRDSDLSKVSGLGYSNNQFFLIGGIKQYWVTDDQLDRETPPEDARNHGLSAELRLPLLQTGYWYSELAGTWYQDYHLDEREPLAAQWRLNRTTRFGNSYLPNKAFDLGAYQVDDRDDSSYGGTLSLMTDLPAEFYLGARGQFSRSDAPISQAGRRGVELDDAQDYIANDPSRLVIPALKGTYYARRASFGEASLSKVINLPLYLFKSPVSLRREALHLRYRHYDLDFDSVDVALNQAVVGLDLELLLVHRAPLRAGVEYAYTDDDRITDAHSVNASLGVSF